MCPSSHLYFDHYQADPKTEPPAFGGFSPLSKVYAFEPIPNELSPAASSHILGVQANLWTEYISTASHAEYMLLPRIAALSEIAWSDKNQHNWDDFRSRLNRMTKFYDLHGYHYRAVMT
jgi:hexosaminidase